MFLSLEIWSKIAIQIHNNSLLSYSTVQSIQHFQILNLCDMTKIWLVIASPQEIPKVPILNLSVPGFPCHPCNIEDNMVDIPEQEFESG